MKLKVCVGQQYSNDWLNCVYRNEIKSTILFSDKQMSSLVHYLSCPAVRRTAFMLISGLAVRLKAKLGLD